MFQHLRLCNSSVLNIPLQSPSVVCKQCNLHAPVSVFLSDTYKSTLLKQWLFMPPLCPRANVFYSIQRMHELFMLTFSNTDKL